jgi:plastocyanin
MDKSNLKSLIIAKTILPKMVNHSSFSCVIIIAAFIVFLTTYSSQADINVNATLQPNNTGSAIHVDAGRGNASMSQYAYFPQSVEVNAGESVIWTNPTEVPEPHTVTFVMANESYAELISPFAIDNLTQLSPVPPNANSAPTIIPQGPDSPRLVLGLNDRAFNPYVIDSQGNVESLPPNGNYTIEGTEKYVNSGTITPSGMTPPGWPPISQFTVTFEQPGTYNYLCIFHPWQTGSVIVR